MPTLRAIARRAKYQTDPAFRENLLRISREYRARNPDRIAAGSRRHRLRSRYGIDLATYDRMLEDQAGVCGICRKEEQIEGRLLAVDHDPRSGLVRGLLCNRCNRGLGFLGDSAERVEAAIAYLRNGN
jgi:hypothetical protein